MDGVSQGDTSPALLPNLWILDEGMPQCGRDPAFCPKGHLWLISCCVTLRHPDFRVSIAERDGVGLFFLDLKF